MVGQEGEAPASKRKKNTEELEVAAPAFTKTRFDGQAEERRCNLR